MPTTAASRHAATCGCARSAPLKSITVAPRSSELRSQSGRVHGDLIAVVPVPVWSIIRLAGLDHAVLIAAETGGLDAVNRLIGSASCGPPPRRELPRRRLASSSRLPQPTVPVGRGNVAHRHANRCQCDPSRGGSRGSRGRGRGGRGRACSRHGSDRHDAGETPMLAAVLHPSDAAHVLKTRAGADVARLVHRSSPG